MPLKPAYTVNEFLAAFGLGRTRFYELINTGAIRAHKNGGRTVVLAADAEAWLNSLPELSPKSAA